MKLFYFRLQKWPHLAIEKSQTLTKLCFPEWCCLFLKFSCNRLTSFYQPHGITSDLKSDNTVKTRAKQTENLCQRIVLTDFATL